MVSIERGGNTEGLHGEYGHMIPIHLSFLDSASTVIG